LKHGTRLLVLSIVVVGCAPKVEPAVDLMQSDLDHRPGSARAEPAHEPIRMPEEPAAQPETDAR
jgi:hypothetical protein